MMSNDRLSALDASFLYLDGPTTPMHIASLAVYEGPPPPLAELVSHLEQRMPLVPRFGQRLATVPGNGHRPVWVADDRFDLAAHLYDVAVPEPRTEAELSHVTGAILSKPLCRTRPLWEMWMIDGLARDRFAILSKTHHSLWDGITGIDLHSVLLDTTPVPDADFEVEPDHARPPPRALDLVIDAARDRVIDAIAATTDTVRALRSPRRAISGALDLARGTASLAMSVLKQAPTSPLNEAIGSRRRYGMARGSFNEMRTLKQSAGFDGATINDVILSVVAGALRRWLIERDIAPYDLKVMIPVSVRTKDESGLLGNRVTMLIVWLPVAERDPMVRLERVHETMTAAKESAQVTAGDAIIGFSSFLPPQAVAAMSKLQARYRAFNLLVTNVPGPQFPLYLRGRELVELFPQAPLASNQGLAVGALSYNGRMHFGLLADHDTIPDVDVIARGIEASLDETLLAARDDTIPEELVPAGLGGLAAAGVPVS
jgi:diacylglycerol O-acyltransferase / wax synthase